MEFNLPKKYLSASAISTLLRCPKQFEFRYIHEIVSPPSIAPITGKAAHGAFEKYYLDAMSTKTVRMKPKAVAEASVDFLKEELKESELTLPPAEYDAVAEDLQDMTESYVEHVGIHTRPFAVETEFTYVSQCGVELFGYLDLLEEIGPEDICESEELGIADYKVTKTKWNMAKLTNSLQFNLYSMATGIPQVTIHNLVKGPRSKTLPKKPNPEGVVDITNKIRLLKTTFNPEFKQHFENLIYSAAKLITVGVFMPCDPEAWCCNSEWCGYWNFCRGAGVSPATVHVGAA